MTSKQIKGSNGSKAEREELLAIKLLYCMDSRSTAEQKRIYDTIKDSLRTAISNVVCTVQGILKQKGYFKGSDSLNDDNLMALVIERTDIQILKDFFHRFYEEGVEKMDMKKIISFYNCITENVQRIRSKEILVLRYFDLEKEQPTTKIISTLIKQPAEQDHISKTNHFKSESKVKSESIPQESESSRPQSSQVQLQNQQEAEDQIEIIEEKSVKKTELSEASKEFIKLFTQDLSKKGKGRTLKKYRIDCLQPGEPTQYWEYYDSLIQGNATVIFTSPK